MVLVAGVSLNVSAQFKIGGKSINTKKLVNAASDAAKAVTLSDEDVAAMAREYIQWMDTHNEIAGPETAMGQRLANLTKDIKVEGLDLNFKVYNVPLISNWENQKEISQKIKNIEIEDLLERKPIVLELFMKSLKDK